MFEGGGTKKSKGISKAVRDKQITHEDYKNCLLTKAKQMRKMNVVRSQKHEIYSEKINKIALSANDDKRFICEDGIHTLAWWHRLLRKK